MPGCYQVMTTAWHLYRVNFFSQRGNSHLNNNNYCALPGELMVNCKKKNCMNTYTRTDTHTYTDGSARTLTVKLMTRMTVND